MQSLEQEKKQKKPTRKSFAAATHAIKMVYPSQRYPVDSQLEQMVYSQSTVVDTIMKDSSDDLARFINYLRQRVELEEGYQNSLDKIIGSVQQTTPIRDLNQSTTLYHGLKAHVDMSINQRSLRQHYIQTIKGQLQALAELKEQHDRARRLRRKNMKHNNSQYLHTRLYEVPAARDAYTQKWQEIERIANTAIPSTPMSPMAPVSFRSNSSTSLFPPLPTRSNSFSDDGDDSPKSHQQNSFANVATTVMAKQQLQSENIPPTPTTPTTPHGRIERFVNRISHMGNNNNNQLPDPAKQSARTAKLKIEVVDADKEYRKMVRKLDALSKRQAMANEAAIKTAQEQLAEKTAMIKEAMNLIMNVEATKFSHFHEMLRNTQDSLNFDPDRDAALYRDMLDRTRHPMPEPIFYHNFHVGECRFLMFGTSLMEYAQQHQRSPPLLVTKCIETIERQGGLEREGIYRISGKQINIDKLKHAFERDEESTILGQNGIPEDVFSVASLLKIFLRELASPLFPFKLGDRVTYSQIPDKELRLMNLLTRILKLPPANYDTLKVLIEHLTKLESFVEKNKMTIKNLSLMFTPAIFQDHNQAQRSPGEWYSDCVLEDLIVNCETLFANKDLRSASAITGVIEYGFHEEQYDFDLPSSPSSSMYARTNSSPTTESDPEYGVADEDMSPQEEHHDPLQQQQQENHSPTTTPTTENKDNDSSDDSSNSHRVSTSMDQQPKFKTASKDRGLKVDTQISNEHITITCDDTLHQYGDQPIPPITTINSATIPPPSHDWLSQDPSSSSNTSNTPGLQRSATVGATLKRTARVPREGGSRRLSRRE
ncbi:hypothetical protein BDA99DRAFT_512774 [Phascolomyces articulosus]|uniref:Rho-GAP domain-containing protein n=1 Tax=Phascolomyces articulosus TaxID=60185 RepID=A0AAD5JYR3_9FUNG|nr:hypothetical protein BDA99DRAFT_512774 [Phascolomyces articulosus]